MANVIISSVESFNNVKNMLKNTKKERDLWKTQFNSLNKLCREMQSREGKKISAPVLAQFGIVEHVNADQLRERFACWVTDKKGNKLPAYTTRTAQVDAEGNEKKDKEGNTLYDYRLTAIRDNAWTFDKLVKCLASK